MTKAAALSERKCWRCLEKRDQADKLGDKSSITSYPYITLLLAFGEPFIGIFTSGMTLSFDCGHSIGLGEVWHVRIDIREESGGEALSFQVNSPRTTSPRWTSFKAVSQRHVIATFPIHRICSKETRHDEYWERNEFNQGILPHTMRTRGVLQTQQTKSTLWTQLYNHHHTTTIHQFDLEKRGYRRGPQGRGCLTQILFRLNPSKWLRWTRSSQRRVPLSNSHLLLALHPNRYYQKKKFI